MCASGERIRAAHPDASFKINITVRNSQRKPSGYDAAGKAGDFKDHAFLHLKTEDGPPIGAPASAKAAS